MEYNIVLATEEDREEIMALYKAQLGRELCPWDEYYPSNETIDADFARDGLFVLKEDGKIKAAISIDEDEEVNRLPCWDEALLPEGELARLAVLPEEQNKGIARVMLKHGMEELKRRGCNGIHILVGKYNTKTIRSYAVFGFNEVGECHLYEQDFLCYEKKL